MFYWLKPIKSPCFIGKSRENPIKSPRFTSKNPTKSPFVHGKNQKTQRFNW